MVGSISSKFEFLIAGNSLEDSNLDFNQVEICDIWFPFFSLHTESVPKKDLNWIEKVAISDFDKF